MTPGVVSAVVAVAGLALLIVSLFVQARVSRRGVSMQVYRDTALAWENKSRAMEQELVDVRAECERNAAEARAELAGRDHTIAELKGRVEAIQDMLTGRAAWEVLEARMGEVLEQVGDVRGLVRVVAEQLTPPGGAA